MVLAAAMLFCTYNDSYVQITMTTIKMVNIKISKSEKIKRSEQISYGAKNREKGKVAVQ